MEDKRQAQKVGVSSTVNLGAACFGFAPIQSQTHRLAFPSMGPRYALSEQRENTFHRSQRSWRGETDRDPNAPPPRRTKLILNECARTGHDQRAIPSRTVPPAKSDRAQQTETGCDRERGGLGHGGEGYRDVVNEGATIQRGCGKSQFRQ